MSNLGDPDFSSEESAPAPESLNGAPPGSQLEDARFPTPGASWLKTYEVLSQVERAQCGPSWTATHLESRKNVVIVWVRSVDPRHDDAWDRLRACTSPSLLKPVEGRLIEDRRFEIFEDCGGVSLSEWKAANPPPSPDLLKAWLTDLADGIESLQRSGLIHGRIEPDNLHVVEDRSPPRLVMAGLESVTVFARAEAVPIATDPFYGPPESVGAPAQSGGEGLLVWDWWSVGRVFQELVLGRHILEHMLDFTMSRQSNDDREFAEKLLLEQAHGETKAGGLEAMPAIDKRVDLLLHGLLTASVDARWGLQDVRQWIQGESPAARYLIGRNERLFRWRGRAWTVPEAAEAMRTAEFWEEARRQVFDSGESDTLAHFVRSDESMQAWAQKIDESSALAKSPALASIPAVPLRELILAIALQRLAGGPLVHRGRAMENLYLRDLAAADKFAGTHLPFIQVLTNATVVPIIEKVDAGAARMLSDSAKLAQRALERCLKQRWMTRSATAEIMRLWSLAFDAASVSQAERQKLKERFARSDNADVEAMFNAENNAPEEVLILAWMSPNAEQKFGFVTHEEWSGRQQAALSDRGRLLASILFWRRLRRVLRFAPILFGGLLAIALTWTLAAAVVGFAWPGAGGLPIALLPALAAIALRAAFPAMIQPLVIEFAPRSAPWRVWDGVARCEKELSGYAEQRMHERDIVHALSEINADLRRINSAATPVHLPPHLAPAKTAATLSWLILACALFLAGNRIRHTPAPFKHFADTWSSRVHTPDEAWYPPPQKEKQDFPFVHPKNPPTVIPVGHGVASEAIVLAARNKGAYLVQDYKPSDIGAPVLVQVPTDEYFGFLLYDPVSRKIMDNRVIVLKDIPPRRVFISIDGRPVFVPNY